ncbi:MAG: hypothetical protein EXR18_07000 [Flavobacteriaceae bacterium]|nr:hypothetical protein [Flavobacteriaceae bacterium]
MIIVLFNTTNRARLYKKDGAKTSSIILVIFGGAKKELYKLERLNFRRAKYSPNQIAETSAESMVGVL